MPSIRTSRTKRAPEGFSAIQDTLDEFANQLRDVESGSTINAKGKPKVNPLHDIVRIHHQRSRYVYELYYDKEAISTALYQWLLKNRYADADLIAKWKKQGYEHLCCVRCIQAKDNIHGNTCICRVPRAKLDAGSTAVSGPCVTCGCLGCASSDM